MFLSFLPKLKPETILNSLVLSES